jgi:hypothetical protein
MRRVGRRIAAYFSVAASLWGCATVRSGDFQIDEYAVGEVFPIIKNRATFDLRCPKGELTLVTLAVDHSSPPNPTQVGVHGCDRRATYVQRAEGMWTMDSAAVTEYTPQAPAVRRRARRVPEEPAAESQPAEAAALHHVRLVRVTPGAEVKLLRYSAAA